MTTAPHTAFTRREPELPGQTVVVIGGSAGIGLETARRARAEGAASSSPPEIQTTEQAAANRRRARRGLRRQRHGRAGDFFRSAERRSTT